MYLKFLLEDAERFHFWCSFCPPLHVVCLTSDYFERSMINTLVSPMSCGRKFIQLHFLGWNIWICAGYASTLTSTIWDSLFSDPRVHWITMSICFLPLTVLRWDLTRHHTALKVTFCNPPENNSLHAKYYLSSCILGLLFLSQPLPFSSWLFLIVQEILIVVLLINVHK